MIAEIINVGTELLLGNIINTNSQFLSDRLAQLGIDIYFHITVGDNKNRLKEVLNNSINRADIIILTGGLGPTEDDITKEAVCEALNKKLVLNNDILEKIKDYFYNCCREMTENNIKQALIPEESEIIPNDIGTAPGILMKDGQKTIILLPGPPKELKIMFDKYVYPLLKRKSNHVIKSKILKIIGIGESAVETYIKDIIHNQVNPTIATYAKEGQVEIRITAKAENDVIADNLIKNCIVKVDSLIKEYIYSYENETIEEVIFKLLDNKRMKIAFSESCTGGLISSRFTEIPGASKVLDRAIITYSNQSKIEELGVKEDTIRKYGAVSAETAIEMARGLKEKSNVDIALSVTGIAGPTGGTKEKPVGLVYIGIATDNSSYVKKFKFNGTRKDIQRRAADNAFNEIRKYLLSIN